MELTINKNMLTPEKMAAYGKLFPGAASKALNKTSVANRAEASRLVREKYNIKLNVVRKKIHTARRASPAKLQSSIKAYSGKYALASFGGKRIDNRHAQAEIEIGKPFIVAGGFLQKATTGRNTGKPIIFKRVGVFVKGAQRAGSRLLSELRNKTIIRAYGPDMLTMFNNTSVQSKLGVFAENRLKKELVSAIKYLGE